MTNCTVQVVESNAFGIQNNNSRLAAEMKTLHDEIEQCVIQQKLSIEKTEQVYLLFQEFQKEYEQGNMKKEEKQKWKKKFVEILGVASNVATILALF